MCIHTDILSKTFDLTSWFSKTPSLYCISIYKALISKFSNPNFNLNIWWKETEWGKQIVWADMKDLSVLLKFNS